MSKNKRIKNTFDNENNNTNRLFNEVNSSNKTSTQIINTIQKPISNNQVENTGGSIMRNLAVTQEHSTSNHVLQIQSPPTHIIEEDVADMSKDQNFVNQINELNKTCGSIIDDSSKAIIILGQEEGDLNLTAYLLKNIRINVIDTTGRGDWAFQEISPRTNTNILDSFNIKTGQCLIYKSSYLNIKNSEHASTIDKFFLQQILSTIPTKFILTIKHIETKDYHSPNTQNNMKNLGYILKKFINLLNNIDIEDHNLSVLFIDTPKIKTIENIGKVINDAVRECGFTKKQIEVVKKLSIYLLPPASEKPKPEDYQELLNITNNDHYITPSKNNKIIIDAKNSDYISCSVNAINNELKLSVLELKTDIEKKWKEGQNAISKYIKDNSDNLSNQNTLSIPTQLKQLINIINNYQNVDNNIENFLEVVKELNQVLGIPKSETKLENLLNYLKYLGNIEFSEKENPVSINPSEWFSNLFGKFEKNIKEEILELFKNILRGSEYSFYNQLNAYVKEVDQYIKDIKVLDAQPIKYMANLKEFFEYLQNSHNSIQSLKDLERLLNYGINNLLPNIYTHLSKVVTKSINALQELIGSGSKEEALSLWKYITTSEAINEVSTNLDKVIYDKLLHTEIPKKQTLHTYSLLEKLLEASHKTVTQKNEIFYNYQLKNIYCKKAQCYEKHSQESTRLYECSAKISSIEANLKLGKIEFYERNFVKSLEYFKNTTSISWMKEAFNNIVKEKKEKISKLTEDNTENFVKLSLELVNLFVEQAKYLGSQHMNLPAENLLDIARVTCLDMITKLASTGENKNLVIIANIYYELAKIAPPAMVHKYIKEAKQYNELAKNFCVEDHETNYTNITDINFFDELTVGMAFLMPYKTSGEISLSGAWSNVEFE